MSSAKDDRWTQVQDPLLQTLLQAVFERLDALDVTGTGFVPPDDSITTDKLVDESVTEPKLAPASVSTRAIGDGVVELSKLANTLATYLPGTPTITVGAEAANVIKVTVQLKDAKNNNLASAHVVQAWLSDTVGGAVTATAPSGGTSIATDGAIVKSLTAGTHLVIASTAAGVFNININEAAAKTWYLNVEYAGKLFSSAAITFA